MYDELNRSRDKRIINERFFVGIIMMAIRNAIYATYIYILQVRNTLISHRRRGDMIFFSVVC